LADPNGEQVSVQRRQRTRKKCQSKRQRRLNQKLEDANNNPIPPLKDIYEQDSESDADAEDESHTIYTRTEPEEWNKIGGQVQARIIKPVPFTGESELFLPDINVETLQNLKDVNGDIRFELVFDWLQPTFGVDDTEYFEWISARMRNYMLHIIQKKGFKPKYYNPSIGRVVTADHVARFYGCHMARMLRGFPSIAETWSTREALDAIGPVKESMPIDAYTDMYRCPMHALFR
jgi:hypothetical protein